ncbi:hypothetical protein B0T20DRAFT_397856 [Sordaria brevicollis]|uniref:Uncharacterized protein n=1 Tax=Sordaria brevicollis TaxID=83679 RepID=A0AAE0U295_SORBR|nr:hypothetical protein B0T20DRAFT_397856 [Sordaria brevicollis]
MSLPRNLRSLADTYVLSPRSFKLSNAEGNGPFRPFKRGSLGVGGKLALFGRPYILLHEVRIDPTAFEIDRGINPVNFETTGPTKFFVYATGGDGAFVKVTKRGAGAASPSMRMTVSGTAHFGLETPHVVTLRAAAARGQVFTVVVRSGCRISVWHGRGERPGVRTAPWEEERGDQGGRYNRLRRREGVDNLRGMYRSGAYLALMGGAEAGV